MKKLIKTMQARLHLLRKITFLLLIFQYFAVSVIIFYGGRIYQAEKEKSKIDVLRKQIDNLKKLSIKNNDYILKIPNCKNILYSDSKKIKQEKK
jgi:hypothetical protein